MFIADLITNGLPVVLIFKDGNERAALVFKEERCLPTVLYETGCNIENLNIGMVKSFRFATPEVAERVKAAQLRIEKARAFGPPKEGEIVSSFLMQDAERESVRKAKKIAALEIGKYHPELQDVTAISRDQVVVQKIASENKINREEK